MTKTKKVLKKVVKAKKSKDLPKKEIWLYKATIKVLGRIFEATGETAKEAIRNLKPGNVKGVGILTMTKGGITKEKILPAVIVFRLFNGSTTMKEIGLKQASMFFDGL